MIAQARTGTGKTFSFAIPLIEMLQGDSQERKRGRTPKVIKSLQGYELHINRGAVGNGVGFPRLYLISWSSGLGFKNCTVAYLHCISVLFFLCSQSILWLKWKIKTCLLLLYRKSWMFSSVKVTLIAVYHSDNSNMKMFVNSRKQVKLFYNEE